MLLTIAIISGLMFLVYFFSVTLGKNDGSTNALTYPAILVLATWALNPTLAIIFLCISIALIIIAIIGYQMNN